MNFTLKADIDLSNDKIKIMLGIHRWLMGEMPPFHVVHLKARTEHDNFQQLPVCLLQLGYTRCANIGDRIKQVKRRAHINGLPLTSAVLIPIRPASINQLGHNSVSTQAKTSGCKVARARRVVNTRSMGANTQVVRAFKEVPTIRFSAYLRPCSVMVERISLHPGTRSWRTFKMEKATLTSPTDAA